MTLPKLEQLTNYASEAATRPIDQYQGKPRMLGWILSYVRRCQEIENAAWDVMIKRMIDYATGAQLDTIGKIVGQARGSLPTDDIYRVYITARIRINRSHGHADDVIDVLMLIEAATFSYSEYYPASAVVTYRSPPDTDPGLLLDLAKLAISAGVQLLIFAPIVGRSTTTVFTLSDYDSPPPGDPLLGLSDDGYALTGGHLAGAYV